MRDGEWKQITKVQFREGENIQTLLMKQNEAHLHYFIPTTPFSLDLFIFK